MFVSHVDRLVGSSRRGDMDGGRARRPVGRQRWDHRVDQDMEGARAAGPRTASLSLSSKPTPRCECAGTETGMSGRGGQWAERPSAAKAGAVKRFGLNPAGIRASGMAKRHVAAQSGQAGFGALPGRAGWERATRRGGCGPHLPNRCINKFGFICRFKGEGEIAGMVPRRLPPVLWKARFSRASRRKAILWAPRRAFGFAERTAA